MKTINLSKIVLFALAGVTLALNACKKETIVNANDATPTAAYGDYYAAALPKDTISGNITTTLTLSADTCYYLQGIVAVNSGAVLNIPAGTTLVGISTVSAGTYSPGALVVARGGKLNCEGSATNPIVFTSYNLVDKNPLTYAAPGDFGGIVLIGDAPSNRPAGTTIEGVPTTGGFDNTYGGGTTSNDNSGKMAYVRIEYGGYNLTAANELNGLTCYAVGSGTSLHHIESYYGKDDGFEFFGGTVNASYLLAVANDDDQFDFDFGYTGTITYGIAIMDPFATHSTSSGASDSNGIECDNDGTGTYATPFTSPKLANFTIIGNPKAAITNSSGVTLLYGIKLRRNTHFSFRNSIVTGYPRALQLENSAALDLDSLKSGSTTVKQISLNNNVFQGFEAAAYDKVTSAAKVLTSYGVNKSYVSASNANLNIAFTQPFFTKPAAFNGVTKTFTAAKFVGTTTTYFGAMPTTAIVTSWDLANWARVR
jgi:hypothetical protein